MDWCTRPECTAVFNQVLADLKACKTFSEKPIEAQYCEVGQALRKELFLGFQRQNWVHVTPEELVSMAKEMSIMLRIALIKKSGKHNTKRFRDRCTDNSDDPVQQLLEAELATDPDDEFAGLALKHRKKRQRQSTKHCADCFKTLEDHWLSTSINASKDAELEAVKAEVLSLIESASGDAAAVAWMRGKLAELEHQLAKAAHTPGRTQ